MSSHGSGGDPLANIIAISLFAIFGLIIVIAVGVVLLPVVALIIAGVLYYRYSQLKKMRVIIPEQQHDVVAPIIIAPNTELLPSSNGYRSPEDFEQEIDGVVLKYLERPTGRFSSHWLSRAFTLLAKQLYMDESFYAPPVRPDSSDLITLARHQDELEKWQKKTSTPAAYDLFLTTVGDFYMKLRNYFPPFAFQVTERVAYSPFTTPLIISAKSDDADLLAVQFFQDDIVQHNLFEDVRAAIVENDIAIKENRTERTFDALFDNTIFAAISGLDIPLTIPDETRFAGSWVIAPQGMGKTTILHDMIIGDLNRDASIILMDSKGELIEPYLKMRAIETRRVIIGPDNPISINPLDIPRSDINKAVDNLEYLFSSLLDFSLTPSQSMLLKAVLRSLVTVFPKPDLATFQSFMSPEGPKKYEQYLKNLEPDLRNFFQHEFSGENMRERRKEVLQRLRLLLDHDLMRSMLLASSTTFNIGDAMDRGAVIIINNSRGRLGIKGAEFFGRFFIAQVLAAAQERSFRSNKDKKPVYFYIDECYTVIENDERITDILHECRSQKIALTLAHQETTQVSDKVLNALQNCAVRFAHPDEEARKLSGTMRMEQKTLLSMQKGQFALYARGLSKEGMIVNVALPDFTLVKPSKNTIPLPPHHVSTPEPTSPWEPRPAEPKESNSLVSESLPKHTTPPEPSKSQSAETPSAPKPMQTTTIRLPGVIIRTPTQSKPEQQEKKETPPPDDEGHKWGE